MFAITGELYEDNTKMLMSNLGAQAPIMEEDEDEYRQQMIDKNETDEDKKRRLEGKVPWADSEGACRGSGPPLKNHKIIGFLSNAGLIPLKITKLPSQHSMLGHRRLASETPFKWHFAGRPMMTNL